MCRYLQILLAVFLVAECSLLIAQQGKAPAPNGATSEGWAPAPPPPAGQKATVQTMESMILSRMHIANRMEIEAGEMAAQKGSTPTMRQFGIRLRLDHQMADSRIISYAHAHNLAVLSASEIAAKMGKIAERAPEPALSPEQMKKQEPGPGKAPGSNPPSPGQRYQQQITKAQSRMRKLLTMQGTVFDAAFTQFIQRSETRAIATLSMAQELLPANNGLRSMMRGFIPILEQHDEIALRLHLDAVRQENRRAGARFSAMLREKSK